MRRDATQREHIRRTQAPAPEDTPHTIETLYIEYDGTGVPMTKNEVAGRKGKQKDGSAKTREAKLGCVFIQTAFDDKGRPIRDPAPTTFTGAIEAAAPFGERIYAEAVRRGLFHAQRVVVLGDGAEWIKTIAQTHFGRAAHIIDLYHAREHLVLLCKLLFDRYLRRLNRYKDRCWDELDEGNIEALTQKARSFLPTDDNAGKDARREIGYFEKNKERMRYGHYKAQGLAIGSGVIEAGCKNIVADRLKKSGMEWTVPGANAIIALRCAELSRRTEDYWEQRPDKTHKSDAGPPSVLFDGRRCYLMVTHVPGTQALPSFFPAVDCLKAPKSSPAGGSWNSSPRLARSRRFWAYTRSTAPTLRFWSLLILAISL